MRLEAPGLTQALGNLASQRLMRATTALDGARILYAVVGGNAVAAWVSRMDEAAVRNTRDVDLLLRREDLAAAKSALISATRRRTSGW
jgi:hypothetical protein